MKVYVLTAYPTGDAHPENIACDWIKQSEHLDPFQVHHLVDNPEEADVILFMEGHSHDDLFYTRVLNHPIRRRFRDKCFLYHDHDYAFPLMAGVYTAIRRQYYDVRACRSGTYMARIAQNHAIRHLPFANDPQFLFSFIGAINCPVRSNLMGLQHPRGRLKDTSGLHAWNLSSHERQAYEQEFVDICQNSEFLLCPRGNCPSSYRLFEAMEMGRCPVILSDDWVEPPFINWSDFSLRVAEKDWAILPQILEAHRNEARDKGKEARKAWEQFVDQPVCFHWLTEACADMLRLRSEKPSSFSVHPLLQLMTTDLRSLYVKSQVKNAMQTLRKKYTHH